MKKTKIGHVVIIIAMTVMAACSSNETTIISGPPVPEPEPEPTMEVIGKMSNNESKTRIAIDVTDPYNTHPNFSKGEKMRWVTGDQICALYDPTEGFAYKFVTAIKALNINGNDATFYIPTTGVAKVGVCRLFFPSVAKIDASNTAELKTNKLEIPSEANKGQYASYVYMYADPFNYNLNQTAMNQAPKAPFHHLTSLLRFNFWNQTGVPYTVKDITIRYSEVNTLKRYMVFPFGNPDNVEYLETYRVNYMKWKNDTYTADPAIVDDINTTDKNEAVYDAMMVMYPTPPQPKGTFTISVTLYDKETLTEFPMQNVVLNCANYDFLKDTGFRKGTRTYFCIDILKDGRAKLRDVQVLPWGSESSLGNVDVELPD